MDRVAQGQPLRPVAASGASDNCRAREAPPPATSTSLTAVADTCPARLLSSSHRQMTAAEAYTAGVTVSQLRLQVQTQPRHAIWLGAPSPQSPAPRASLHAGHPHPHRVSTSPEPAAPQVSLVSMGSQDDPLPAPAQQDALVSCAAVVMQTLRELGAGAPKSWSAALFPRSHPHPHVTGNTSIPC